jgi:coenzyme Q-binding protein COQ10
VTNTCSFWPAVRSYTPRELYNVVANVPSYNQFLPFCTSSTILHDARINAEKPFEVEAELKVGFMGFSEGYVSKVKGTPFQAVEVRKIDLLLFALYARCKIERLM